MSDPKFDKTILFINGLVPLTLLGWDAWHGRLGTNPVEFFLRTTGVLTLVFVVLTLAVTPFRKWFQWNELIKVRRMLGLFAFFYGCVHLLTYFVLDRSGSLAGAAEDIVKRPFIAIGLASFIMMVPLAITSTNNMVKRLGGKSWRRLHRLTYLVGIGGVIHFWMIVKSDVFYPVLFGGAVLVLLGYRVAEALKKRLAGRQKVSLATGGK